MFLETVYVRSYSEVQLMSANSWSKAECLPLKVMPGGNCSKTKGFCTGND